LHEEPVVRPASLRRAPQQDLAGRFTDRINRCCRLIPQRAGVPWYIVPENGWTPRQIKAGRSASTILTPDLVFARCPF